MPDPIVLAFSGGLDTSFLVPWLAETLRPAGDHRDRRHRRHRCGRRRGRSPERARALGAVAHHLWIDARRTTSSRCCAS